MTRDNDDYKSVSRGHGVDAAPDTFIWVARQ